MIVPVVMAGGSGTRLWPLSRQDFPKQFLALTNDNTMLQSTLARLEGLPCDEAIVICGEDQRFTVAEQLHQIDANHSGIILEPEGRNTAPAIALAAIRALNCAKKFRNKGQGGKSNTANTDPVLLVLAADHAISDIAGFQKAVDQALPLAEAGKLVTFGIVPTGPETAYGYIRGGKVTSDSGKKPSGMPIAEFVEKPDSETAEKNVSSGDYYWNSGMFMFRASCYLQELKSHRPDILTACEKAMSAAKADADFIRVDKKAFLDCPAESIDYAVMEKTEDAFVVPMDCGWSDVGSWSSLLEIMTKDEAGNAVSGDVIIQDSRNCLVRSSGRLVATLGLDDLIVIETDDAVLVAAKDRVQDVKKIVESLNEQGRTEAKSHRKVYRPWGFYDSIDSGARFQVKRIVVNPGAKLSLQMHHHRAEHWVVVSGTARVTNGDKVYLVAENESTYIPVGQIHSLENPGVLPLELIEVQSGTCLGEDDIVRLEDKYGRVE